MNPTSSLIFHKRINSIFAEERLSFPDNSMNQRHLHSSVEFYFLIGGERYYFIEQDTIHMKPGMAVMINAHQIHKTHTVNRGGFHRFLLQLDANIMDLYTNLSDNFNLISKPYIIVEFPKEDWQELLTTWETLKDKMNDKNDYTMSLLMTMQIVTLFFNAYKKQQVSNSNNTHSDYVVHTNKYEVAHEIILYIQEHFSEECSLNEIAARFYISRAYLTRTFKLITGFTIKEYVTFCRVKYAKTLLTTSNLSITEIAGRAGFGSTTNFERNFKNMTSLTPLQYRKHK